MVDEAILNLLKEMLGYTDAQWETWQSNPRNLKVAETLPEAAKYRVIAEVTSSHGCLSGHKVGDKIVCGPGAILCKENPERVCLGLLCPIWPLLITVFEKICSGDDPTQIAFNKVHCVDVGVENGGWGEVVVDVKVEKTQE